MVSIDRYIDSWTNLQLHVYMYTVTCTCKSSDYIIIITTFFFHLFTRGRHGTVLHATCASLHVQQSKSYLPLPVYVIMRTYTRLSLQVPPLEAELTSTAYGSSMSTATTTLIGTPNLSFCHELLVVILSGVRRYVFYLTAMYYL